MDHMENLRYLVRDCLGKHLYSSAVFFADKLVTLSAFNPADVYLLAQSYYLSKQFRRALYLLRDEGLLSSSSRFKYIAAKCLEEVKEWDECLAVLGEDGDEERETQQQAYEADGTAEDGREISIIAALCLQRGKAYDALENRSKSLYWYKRALEADPFCYEAFERLISNQLLTIEEENELLESLQFGPGEQWLHLFYSCSANKHGQEDVVEAQLATLEGCPPLEGEAGACWEEGQATLDGNLDVQACRAECQYQRGDFERCYHTSQKLLERDPYRLSVMPCHLAAALELRRKNELFLQAHKLVEEYPALGLAWFAVGCYYLCIRQHDQARRYFCKATTLESSFLPAWLGFGNAYAAQDESDQAMASYRTTARLFPGCHLAVLGIGMEYQRTNNLQLALQFLEDARRMCPWDPLVHHELGVLAYRTREYQEAQQHFEAALQLVPPSQMALWDATVLGMAHVLRKLGLYPEAVQCYEQALGLCPSQAGTYSALGFTHHLQGNLSGAIEEYHKALGLRPDDSLTAELLSQALSEECGWYAQTGEEQFSHGYTTMSLQLMM